VIAGAAAVVAVAALGATRLHVDTTFKRQFPASHPVRRADDLLGRTFSGTNTLVFLVDGPVDGALHEPAALRAIDDLQRFLETDPAVGKTLSIVDYVKEIHRALNGGDAAIPERADLVSQYLLLYAMSGGPEDLDSQIDPAHRRAAVRAFVRTDSTEHAEHLLSRVRAHVAATFPPGYRVQYSGTIASTAALTETMVHGKVLNMLQIAVIIVLVSALVLRSLVGGLLIATPLAVAVLVNFGVMGFAGIPLDVITSPIAAMAVGIGSDYAIYFLFRFREELPTSRTPALALAATMQTSGKAIAYVSSAIAGGYLVLCVSGFVFHLELGALVALAMVVSSLAAITLLPALALVLEPAFLFAAAPRTAAASVVPTRRAS
jgi:predicted RND superfamily exporter protein